jgi:hypothetical protein
LFVDLFSGTAFSSLLEPRELLLSSIYCVYITQLRQCVQRKTNTVSALAFYFELILLSSSTVLSNLQHGLVVTTAGIALREVGEHIGSIG